jgi:hypothetical protein
MPQSAVAQPMLTHIKPLTTTAEQILFGHYEVFDLDFAVRSTESLSHGGMPMHGVDIS